MQQGAHSLEQLAAMGNFGNHKSNIFRAMRTILGIPKGACDIDWLPIPMKAGRYTPHPFLLPHKFFEAFYVSNEIKVWRDVMAGPVGACRSYWQECQGTDFVRHHPKLPSSSWGSTIPLGMHADAGAFSSHDSLYTISWNSLLGRGSTIKKRFLFTVLRKSDMTPDSLNSVLEIFSWSMNQILAGLSPSKDVNDRPIAGGVHRLASE